MRKTIVVTCASMIVAAAAAPAANAEKATFKGTCGITGVAAFEPPLTSETKTMKYDFKSGAPADGAADATKCTGKLNGKSVTDVATTAVVAGEGGLSCAMGQSTTPGVGALTFPDGSTFAFTFEFTSILTEVDFTATFGGTKLAGHASFKDYAPPTTAFDCSPAGAGIKSLGFAATTEESSVPIEGTRPDSANDPPGGNPPAGNPPSGNPPGGEPGGTDKPTAAERRKACMKKAKKKTNKKKRKKAVKRCKAIK
jgi:hypothetical protein